MKSIFTNFLKSQKGFSLIQTLVGAAIVGGLSLVAARLSTQESTNKLVADSNYGVLELTGRIQTLVSNELSCKLSLAPHATNVALNSTINIPTLKTIAGTDVYSVNGLYVDQKVRITAMTLTRTERNSILSVTMQRQVGKSNLPATVKKDFFINAEWNANKLEGCASDITNFIDTVVSEAISQACMEEGDPDTTPQGLVRDGETCKALYQMKEDNSALRCGNDESIVGLIWDPVTRIYKPECRAMFNGGIPVCADNQLLKRNTDGSFTCVTLSCPPNTISQGLDTDGNMRCFGCPAGTFMVASTDGWKCSPSMCANTKNVSQQYFVGFDSNGDPVCNPLADSGTVCPQGGKLAVGPKGEIKLDCCTPDCSDSSNKCEGTNYASNNGCGVCTGTKAKDCSNSNLYCVGTTGPAANGCGTCEGTKAPDCSNNSLYCAGVVYNSANGCGTCTGSKPAQNASWGAWTPTGEYREKSGASCSKTCGGGTIQTQRKYVRTCNNDQACGGSPCVGVTEEWRDEGTAPCNTRSCGNYKWCSSPPPYAACVCMNVDTGEFPVALANCADSDTSCALEDCVKTTCTPRCTANAASICSGSSVTMDDGCGGKCPTVYGTSPYTCASGKCLCPFYDGVLEMPMTSGGLGGGGCFVAGTMITMADGSLKNIEDIQVGDELVDGSQKTVTVQKLIPLDYEGEIYSINGGAYFFTPNHPFMTLDGWKSLDPDASNKETPGLNVKRLQIGDVLVKQNGIEVVLTLDSKPVKEKVYNFELDGSHEYIADGYVVHNKRAPDEPIWP